MKLSEIEAAGEITTIYDNDNYKWTGIIADRTLANYGSASDYQDKRALDFEKSRKVYTADQMQEYAKAKVLETVELYAKDGSAVPVDFIKEFVLKIIFEEDTKND
jgi:hypothetical protein